MRKKDITTPLLFILICLAIIEVAYMATTSVTLKYLQQIGVAEHKDIEAYLDDTQYINGTTISWVCSGPGEYTKTLKVVNVGNVALTVTIEAQSLPEGTTETWTQDGTILNPTEETEGTLTLTVSPTTTPGIYDTTLLIIGTP